MDVVAGLGIIGLLLVAWSLISVGAALVLWTTLVASKGLKPADGTRTAAPGGAATPPRRPEPQNATVQPRLVPAIAPGMPGNPGRPPELV